MNIFFIFSSYTRYIFFYELFLVSFTLLFAELNININIKMKRKTIRLENEKKSRKCGSINVYEKQKLICWTFFFIWQVEITFELAVKRKSATHSYSYIKEFPNESQLKGNFCGISNKWFHLFQSDASQEMKKKIISIENHMCVVFSITVAVQPVEMIFYEYLKIDFFFWLHRKETHYECIIEYIRKNYTIISKS